MTWVLDLPVLSAGMYDERFPNFRQPTELGSFSLDSERQFQPDNRNLKYLVMPQNPERVRMDLNKGYEHVLKKAFGRVERLDSMLHWVAQNKSKVVSNFANSSENFGPDFVCYRGLLTNIICTITENKDDWLICATKWRGTIYLCAFDTESAKQRKMSETPRESLMSSWGYKFEQYMVADKLGGQQITHVPVVESEEFCIVVKGRLNSHTILYSAEVDGVDPAYKEAHLSTRQYMELKTSRVISSRRQHENFHRFKTKKWWAQSFLIGIPKVICGFRDDDGIVRFVETFNTSDLPKQAKGYWSAAAGMNFCDAFLSFVKNCVQKDDAYVVYQFYWQPGKNVSCHELSEASDYQILPEWYISSFATKSK